MGLLLFFKGAAPPPSTPAHLIDAILQHLRADSAVSTAIPGGIWGDETPPEESFPYAVIGEPDSQREFQTTANPADGVPCDDRVTITIAVYATGKAQAKDAAKLVRTSLNDALLTFTGGDLLYLRATSLSVSKDPDKSSGGSDVWSALLSLSAIVSEFA